MNSITHDIHARAGTCLPRHGARRRGFTLLETLVAIAAVIVVAAGLATIFRSVGDAVSTGRRVSRVNQYARLLEQQMRRDFATMTRDGFLSIRQQYADADADGRFTPDDPNGLGDRVSLFEDEPADSPSRRPRRIDEVVFFARGDFRSLRPPLVSEEWAPTSTEARIYYGHGQRMAPPRGSLDTPEHQARFFAPKLNDTNSVESLGLSGRLPLLGVRPGTGEEDLNPNRYASSWILLRQVTLLAPVSSSREQPPAQVFDLNRVYNGGRPDNDFPGVSDKLGQIAGQPASASIFRALNRVFGPGDDFGTPPDPRNWVWMIDDSDAERHNYYANSNIYPFGPVVASGLVDVATMSLADVRAIVTGYADVRTAGLTGLNRRARLPGQFLLSNDATSYVEPFQSFPPSIRPANLGVFNATGAVTNPPGDGLVERPPYGAATSWEALDYIHAWMDQAFPTRGLPEVDGQTQVEPAGFARTGFTEPEPDRGARIRAEAESPELLVVLGQDGLASDDVAARAQAVRRADRVMLQASNLVIGCSEFKVDWSFGSTNSQTGEANWYGPDTPAGFFSASHGEVYGRPAAQNPAPGNPGVLRPFTYPVTARLIYGYNPRSSFENSGQVPLCTTSYFGFSDPTWTLDTNANGLLGESNDMAIDSVRPTVPWPWPKLVRVTVTIADPVDPRIESTFEFVFDVPEARVQ